MNLRTRLRRWLDSRKPRVVTTIQYGALPDDIVDLMHRNETLTAAFAAALNCRPTLGIPAAQILESVKR